jgi:hypothetical protein
MQGCVLYIKTKKIVYINTDVRQLTTGIRSEKCVVRRIHRCAYVIECTRTNLHSIAYYTPRLIILANGRWDLIWLLKVKGNLLTLIHQPRPLLSISPNMKSAQNHFRRHCEILQIFNVLSDMVRVRPCCTVHFPSFI